MISLPVVASNPAMGPRLYALDTDQLERVGVRESASQPFGRNAEVHSPLSTKYIRERSQIFLNGKTESRSGATEFDFACRPTFYSQVASLLPLATERLLVQTSSQAVARPLLHVWQ